MEMLEKAAVSDADEVMLDLEDAVAKPEKKPARANVCQAINEFDWSDKIIAIRINGLNTPYAYNDIIEVVSEVGEKLDVLIVPKIERSDDVYMVDKLLTEIELDHGIENDIGLEVLIEEVEAMQNVNEIAATGERLEALIFGPGDYSASQGVTLDSIGGDTDDELYPGDIWHYARNKIVVAARANGLAAIDGPFGDISDRSGYRRECTRSYALGFTGKWAIHPSQIAIANEVFAPSREKVDHAQRVVDAMNRGEQQGKGAVRVDGEMLDEASVRKARRVLDRARTIGMVE